MSKKEKGCLFAAGVVIAAVAALPLISPILFWSRGEVKIVNEAHEPIGGGHFTVCKQRFELGQIEPKASRQFDYKINCKGDYDVTLEFVSGKKLTKKVGYVETSSNFHHTLTVKDDDIDIVVTSLD